MDPPASARLEYCVLRNIAQVAGKGRPICMEALVKPREAIHFALPKSGLWPDSVVSTSPRMAGGVRDLAGACPTGRKWSRRRWKLWGPGKHVVADLRASSGGLGPGARHPEPVGPDLGVKMMTFHRRDDRANVDVRRSARDP